MQIKKRFDIMKILSIITLMHRIRSYDTNRIPPKKRKGLADVDPGCLSSQW